MLDVPVVCVYVVVGDEDGGRSIRRRFSAVVILKKRYCNIKRQDKTS